MLRKKNHAYFFPIFPHKKVLAVFSDRFYNLGFYNNTVEDLKSNRLRFLKSLGLNYRNLVCTRQPHSKKIVLIGRNQKGKGSSSFKDAIAKADGLLSNEKKLPLAVFTADCLSAFLFDPKNNAIGLVHAGWRGTYKRISVNAVLKMRKFFGTNPQDLIVGFGPAIRNCCYEVGSVFKRYFPKDLIKRKNKLYFDIIAANLKQLTSHGIKKENIFDSKICTCCQGKQFFSYRKEGKRAGRMMSLIMLK